MNRLNLGSAYYNALEAVATKRYSNGVMFAVNYTRMKLEDEINFFTDYDADPVPRPPGRPAAASPRHHHAHRSAVRSGKPIGSNTTGLVAGLIGGWQFNTIGEIQSGRPARR